MIVLVMIIVLVAPPVVVKVKYLYLLSVSPIHSIGTKILGREMAVDIGVRVKTPKVRLLVVTMLLLLI